MNFKKILSGIMVLSIVGASSLTMGTTVKAASLNNVEQSARSPWAGSKLHAQMGLHGFIYWCRVPGATDYELEVVYLPDNTDIIKGYGNSTYRQEDISDALNNNYIGKHSVNVKALDADGNILDEGTFYFNYDGVKTYMIE
ncbi:hypothetical protein [Clostridium botulinum]|uniref:hypothetical protein n=1 Tax=Clostridium botulinum TaxID=1491 RepID=UPI0007730E8A|nr:hypothetical protein [Clostridium botulinum]